jgi:antagonist of KipI
MIEVIKPGLLSTVQDEGRWGFQSYGVGVSGAMDPFALATANLLAGNPEGAAGLEITLLGPTLKFQREAVFALAGADLDPRIDGNPIHNWACHRAPAGSVLSFGGRRTGVRAYLAVNGGIDVPPVMGSRSTYLLGRFGGMQGRALKAGDLLPQTVPGNHAGDFVGRVFPEELRPCYQSRPTLRVVLGPFDDFFSEEGIGNLLSTPYIITPQSDRMGYRLKGAPVKRQRSGELITCGLANGTIQVPPDGQPILLLVDRQTIGGYPIIATMIHADLSQVAQSAPGDHLRFSAVGVDEGREAYLELLGNLDKFKGSLNKR